MGPRPSGRGTSTLDDGEFSTSMRQWGRGRVAAERAGMDLHRSQSRRVNGAAAEWPRNARRTGSRSLRASASMGPRPSGRGTLDRTAGGAVLPMRQWGRGRVAAERGVRGYGRPAYMASMGPRPSGRGTRLVGAMFPFIVFRVNGAAAEWPRNVLCLLYDVVGDRRQWGRGRVAAERVRARRAGGEGGRVNGAAAEWPRNVSRPLSLSLYGLPASMGPRPSGRGTSAVRSSCSRRASWRQWGRGRVAAERWPRPSRRTGTGWRQWGRGRVAAERQAPLG